MDVRHGAMKSLSAVVGAHFHLMKPFVNDSFWTTIRNNMLIDESLIIEVDYGITKEKKDTGKPLRLEAFNFLKIAMGKFSLEGHIHELLQVCLEKIGTPPN